MENKQLAILKPTSESTIMKNVLIACRLFSEEDFMIDCDPCSEDCDAVITKEQCKCGAIMVGDDIHSDMFPLYTYARNPLPNEEPSLLVLDTEPDSEQEKLLRELKIWENKIPQHYTNFWSFWLE